MRRLPVLLALNALFMLPQPAAADPVDVWRDGQVSRHEDPFLPGPDPLPSRARATGPPVARAAAASTRRALRSLLETGAIDQATYDARTAEYDAVLERITRLRGARRAHLRSTVAEVDRVAAAGGLSAERLPLAFLTIRRNQQWWTTGPVLAGGRRVRFAGSRLIWQHYPGSGLQVQWLGTFGRANGLFQSTRHDVELRELLTEAHGLAVPRAGGLAWESWFSFGGGRPGWVSSLSAGTAAQVYARAAIRLSEPAFFEVGRQALGVFRAPPPDGVRVDVGAGAHYLIYSFAPALRVLNAFTQAVNGLRDFAVLANDAPARELFAAGEARLREELPAYDTGAWSLYSTTREADLGYHRLARDFLRGLCNRLTDDRARGVPGPDPGAYCQAADRFTAYTHRRPRIAFEAPEPARPRARRKAAVPFTLDKVATTTTSVSLAGRVVAARTTRRARGRHSVVWTPARPGRYRVVVRAVDLAGNAATRVVGVRVASPSR